MTAAADHLQRYAAVPPGWPDFSYETEAVRFDRDLKNDLVFDKDGKPDTSLGLVTMAGNVLGRTCHRHRPRQRYPSERGTRHQPADEASYGYIKPKLKYAVHPVRPGSGQQGKAQAITQSGTGLWQLQHAEPRRPDLQRRQRPVLRPQHQLFRQELPPDPRTAPVLPLCPVQGPEGHPALRHQRNLFSYDSLFRDNRFSGTDRIGDENKLSLGVTSRWIEDNGFERQRFSIGQAFYFKDRKVQLPGIDYHPQGQQSDVSPYALEYEYRFNRDWRFNSDFNWDPDSRSTRSGSAMFHYQPEDNPNKVVNLGYRYRNDQITYDSLTGKWKVGGGDYGTPGEPGYIKDYYKIQQHDFSVIWPIVPQWSVIAAGSMTTTATAPWKPWVVSSTTTAAGSCA
jgi:LPS-assembly protein